MTQVTLDVPTFFVPFFQWAAGAVALGWTIYQHFQHEKQKKAIIEVKTTIEAANK